ncbi:hypothetical protein [Ensifer sp. LCM 4579]|nr:hypothetical protein [Ensifer sp. LCM 4579]
MIVAHAAVAIDGGEWRWMTFAYHVDDRATGLMGRAHALHADQQAIDAI